MITQSNTPGAKFVKLLREYLHGDPNWEMERLSACHKAKNVIKCFAGLKNYNEDTPLNQIKMPFNEDVENPTTAYEMNKFQDTDNNIASLGTHPTCLPFMLAGSTVSKTGTIIELGPFAGFSSKCLAAGIKTTGAPRENSMFVYDSYNDMMNYRAISKSCPWVKNAYPDFTEDNTDFLQLWKDTVQFVYPKAEPKQMYASSKTLNDEVLGTNNLEVFVIDTAKHAIDLHNHMGNLTIPAGSVFFTNDFQFANDNILQFYSCFRNHMIPVFSSFIEQWAWVVTKSFKVNQPWVKKCYAQMAENEKEAREIMIKQATEDITFLTSGLTDDQSSIVTDDTKAAREYWREKRALPTVVNALENTKFDWAKLSKSF